jgi:hypothetical protein
MIGEPGAIVIGGFPKALITVEGLIRIVLLPTTINELLLARLNTVPPIVAPGPPAVNGVPPTMIGELGAIVIGGLPGPLMIVNGELIEMVLLPTTINEPLLARLNTVSPIVTPGPPRVNVVPLIMMGEVGPIVIAGPP